MAQHEEQSKDKTGTIRTYFNLGMGNYYLGVGKYDKAEKHLQVSLNIAKQIGDNIAKGAAYGNLGVCYSSLGQYDKAIQYHELDLNIAKQIGNKIREGVAYGNLGTCYYNLGQRDKAMQQYELSLNIAKQIGDKAGEGVAYGNLGACYSDLGQHDKARHHHELKLNIAKQIGNKDQEGVAYGNLGTCYSDLGQYDKAIQHHELKLKIAKQIGDKAGEGVVYGNLGDCYINLGQYDKAIQHHQSSLNIAKQIGDKAGEGAAYGSLGFFYCNLKQYDKAIQHHKLSLNIAKQIGDKAGESAANGNLGVCYYHLGQYDKAIQHHELFQNIAKQIGDKTKGINNYHSLSMCYFHLGQYDKAERNFRSGVEYFQELLKNVPNEDSLKVSFIETCRDIVSSLITVLLVQGKTDDALLFAENVRSTALAELLVKRYHLPRTEHQVLVDLPQILEVVKAVDSTVLFFTLLTPFICVWVIKPSGDANSNKNVCSYVLDLNSLISNAMKMLTSHCTVECEDRSLSFLYKGELTSCFPAASEGLVTLEHRVLSSVRPDKSTPLVSLQTAGLSMLTLSEQLKVAECPSKGKEGEHPSKGKEAKHPSEGKETEHPSKGKEAEHPSKGKEVKHPSECKEAVSGSRSVSDSTFRPLEELYQILAPVRHLVEGSQVVIVPHGALPLVPFAALIDENGRYVAESLQVRLVPSLATAKMIREYPQEPAGQGIPLIVGDPDVGMFTDGGAVYTPPRLPSANEEALVIGQLLQVQPLTGARATRQTVLDKAESANLIHIAAHGDAERGEILFAPSPGVDKMNVKKEDVILRISHLEEKRLKAKLVVLSCCHSGCGEVKTEGVIGIARAFLGAGARAVLVTLWAIDDKATLYFMRKFYNRLARGKKASEALSGAMKAMREVDAFCHPYFWAPFVLIGDDVTLVGTS